MDEKLIFIKLGGSLITYKDQPETARLDIIKASLQTIKKIRKLRPTLKILLGHGSGSFGHTLAKQYGTMNGVFSTADWLGFAEVAKAAKALNDLVYEIGLDVGLPLQVFRPSILVLTHNRQIVTWDTAPIQDALLRSQIPLVYGDVVVDTSLGGTILSTEELFLHLTELLKPSRMLIAGIDAGVFADFPENTRIIPTISRDDLLNSFTIDGSQKTDVTGGMLAKVRLLQAACALNPGMKAYIYSGLEIQNTKKIISGKSVGTLIR